MFTLRLFRTTRQSRILHLKISGFVCMCRSSARHSDLKKRTCELSLWRCHRNLRRLNTATRLSGGESRDPTLVKDSIIAHDQNINSVKSNFHNSTERGGENASFEELYEWIRTNGISFEKLELRQSVDKGVSIHAKEDIPANSTLCSIPARLCLTVDMADSASVLVDAWEKAFGEKAEKLAEGMELISHEESTHIRFWILLCALRRIYVHPEKMARVDSEDLATAVESVTSATSRGAERERIDFGPYFRALPESHSDLLWWSDIGMELLKGTNVYDTAMRSRRGARLLYENLNRYFIPHFPILRDGFTYSEFIWAWSTHRSRCFSSQRFFLGKQFFMCPCLDFCNHHIDADLEWISNVTSKNSLYNDSTTLSYFADYEIRKGNEVFNSYGPKGNDMLLSSYGFIEPNNTLEKIVLDVDVDIKDTRKFSKFKRGAVERGERFSRKIQGKLTTLQKIKLLDLPAPYDYFLSEDVCPSKPPPCTSFGEIDHKMDGLATQRMDFISEIRGLEWILIAQQRVLFRALFGKHELIELRDDFPFLSFKEWLQLNSSSRLVEAIGAPPYECWVAVTYMNRHVRSVRDTLRETNYRLGHARQGLANIDDAFSCEAFTESGAVNISASPSAQTRNFLEWVQKVGGWVHSCLQSEDRDDLTSGTNLVELPAEKVISVEKALQSKTFLKKFGNLQLRGYDFTRELSERILIILFLIHETFEKKENSDFWPILLGLRRPEDQMYHKVIKDLMLGLSFKPNGSAKPRPHNENRRRATDGFEELCGLLSALHVDNVTDMENLGDASSKTEDETFLETDLPITIKCTVSQSLKPLILEYQKILLPLIKASPISFSSTVYSVPNFIWAAQVVDVYSRTLFPPHPEVHSSSNSGSPKLLLLPFPPLMARRENGANYHLEGYPCAEWDIPCDDRGQNLNRIEDRRGGGLLRIRLRKSFLISEDELRNEHILSIPAACERGVPLDNVRRFLFWSQIIPNSLSDFVEVPIDDVLTRFYMLSPNLLANTTGSTKAYLVEEHKKRVDNYPAHLLRRWSGGTPISHAFLELFEICQLNQEEATRLKVRGLDAIYPRKKTWWAAADYVKTLLDDCRRFQRILAKRSYQCAFKSGLFSLAEEQIKILRFVKASLDRHLQLFGSAIPNKWFMGCDKCEERAVTLLADGKSGLLHDGRSSPDYQWVNATDDCFKCKLCQFSNLTTHRPHISSSRQPIWHLHVRQ